MTFDLETTSRELLRWLEDKGASAQDVRLEEFGEQAGLNPADLNLLADDLVERGLARPQRGFGSIALSLTPRGVRETQQLHREPPAAPHQPASEPGTYTFINITGNISVGGSNYSQQFMPRRLS